MEKIENKSCYIGFSYFKNICGIKNINFDFEMFFSEKKEKSDKYNLYFFYSDKNVLNSSLQNLIFLLKNFEKDFFLLNNFKSNYISFNIINIFCINSSFFRLKLKNFKIFISI